MEPAGAPQHLEQRSEGGTSKALGLKPDPQLVADGVLKAGRAQSPQFRLIVSRVNAGIRGQGIPGPTAWCRPQEDTSHGRQGLRGPLSR